jgi:hypothetical protein
MKNLTFLFFLFFFVQNAKAQDAASSNQFIVGGTINFLAQNNGQPYPILVNNLGLGIYSTLPYDSKNTIFSFRPYFGKEINPRLMLGFEVGYATSSYKSYDVYVSGQTNPMDFEDNAQQLGFGVFTRHTLNPDNLFELFLEPSVEYVLFNEKRKQDGDITNELKSGYVELDLNTGAMYNINDRFRAVLKVGGLRYVNGKWKNVGSSTSKNFNSFGLNFNLSSISFGLDVKL